MDVVIVRLAEDGLIVSLSYYLLVSTFALGAGLYYWRQRHRVYRSEFEIDEAELGIGSQKLILRRNQEDLGVAYKIWVELTTRKVGLPIDVDHDVIAEVYNSWYEFFGVTRELIKELPASKLRRGASIDHLIRLSTDVLNNGLRPHLTKWQARFRRWYERQLHDEGNLDLSPQEIQLRYPSWPELVDDLTRVNAQLIYYRERMRSFVFDREEHAGEEPREARRLTSWFPLRR